MKTINRCWKRRWRGEISTSTVGGVQPQTWLHEQHRRNVFFSFCFLCYSLFHPWLCGAHSYFPRPNSLRSGWNQQPDVFLRDCQEGGTCRCLAQRKTKQRGSVLNNEDLWNFKNHTVEDPRRECVMSRVCETDALSTHVWLSCLLIFHKSCNNTYIRHTLVIWSLSSLIIMFSCTLISREHP